MSKRFVDTDLWQKSWFQELEAKEKLIVLYLFQNCDCAGVWDVNYRLAGFILGFTINQDIIVKINQKHLLFDFFKEDKILVLDFIKFQYGTLSENCKPHRPIIEKLKKYGLYERVLKGYPKGIETLEEKEKEKEIEKDKEKEINDPYVNPYVNTFKREYKKYFNARLYLTAQERTKIIELASSIDDFEETIPVVIEKLKNIDFGFENFKPTVNWLLKDSNYTAVLNGTYDKQESAEDAVFRRLRERNQSSG